VGRLYAPDGAAGVDWAFVTDQPAPSSSLMP